MHFDGLTPLVNFKCVLFFKILDNLLSESGKLFISMRSNTVLSMHSVELDHKNNKCVTT